VVVNNVVFKKALKCLLNSYRDANVIPKSQKQNSKKAEKSILSAFFSFISHIFLIDTDQGQIN